MKQDIANIGNWSEQQEAKKEVKEKDKVRRENIAKYFLDLSKLTFTALVLGGVTCMFTTKELNLPLVLSVISGGIATTILLAKIGNQIFK